MDELRHHYAEIDAVRLHWAELGSPSARPPVVLLHGIADSHLTWRVVAPDLARDRVVLMPDLPGCGLSSRPNASYALQWHAQIIARWLERCGLAQVDVVGHSFGGGVAQMLLLECPERIRRIVLVASGGLGRDTGFWLKFATFPHFVEHYGQPFMAFGTRRALRHASDERAREDVKALSVMNAVPGTARAFSRTVRDVLDFRGQRRHFLERAHEVASLPPVAVLWGARDAAIPIEGGREFLTQVENVRFTSFPDAGHHLHQDAPGAFVAAVRGFLDDPDALPARVRAGAGGAAAQAPLGRKMIDDVVRGVQDLGGRCRAVIARSTGRT